MKDTYLYWAQYNTFLFTLNLFDFLRALLKFNFGNIILINVSFYN